MLSPGLQGRSFLFGFLLAADEGWLSTTRSFAWFVNWTVRPIFNWYIVSHLVREHREGRSSFFVVRPAAITDDECWAHDIFDALIVVMSFIEDDNVRREPTTHPTWSDVVEDEAQLVVIQTAEGVGLDQAARQANWLSGWRAGSSMMFRSHRFCASDRGSRRAFAKMAAA